MGDKLLAVTSLSSVNVDRDKHIDQHAICWSVRTLSTYSHNRIIKHEKSYFSIRPTHRLEHGSTRPGSPWGLT